MKNEILGLLEGEIERGLKDIGTLTPGTQEYGDAVTDLCKLYELRLKEKSNETSHEEKQAQLELTKGELELKQKQANHQNLSEREELDFKKKQFEDDRERFDSELELKKKQTDHQINSDHSELKFKKEQFEDDKERFDRELALKKRQLVAEETKNSNCFDVDKRKIYNDNIREAVKGGGEIGLVVLKLTFYAVWMYKGFKFEETGTYTSTTFKNLFNWFRPTKN